MSRRAARVSWVLAGALALLAVAWMLLGGARKGVRISKIDEVEATLLKEGFECKEQQHVISSVAMGPLTPIVRRIPGCSSRSENRSYVKEGSRLGIGFEVHGSYAANVSVSADPSWGTRAPEIARVLREANPELVVSVWTNEAAAKGP